MTSSVPSQPSAMITGHPMVPLVETVHIGGFQVIDGQGPADPGMVGHGRGIRYEGPTSLILQRFHQGPYDNGSKVSHIIRFSHVGFHRHQVARLQVVQPSGILQDFSSLMAMDSKKRLALASMNQIFALAILKPPILDFIFAPISHIFPHPTSTISRRHFQMGRSLSPCEILQKVLPERY